MSRTNTLAQARYSIDAFMLDRARSRESLENFVIDELARRFALFIVQERSGLISVRESEPGIIQYEIRAHVMTPKELEQLVGDEIMMNQIISMQLSSLQQQEDHQ